MLCSVEGILGCVVLCDIFFFIVCGDVFLCLNFDGCIELVLFVVDVFCKRIFDSNL